MPYSPVDYFRNWISRRTGRLGSIPAVIRSQRAPRAAATRLRRAALPPLLPAKRPSLSRFMQAPRAWLPTDMPVGRLLLTPLAFLLAAFFSGPASFLPSQAGPILKIGTNLSADDLLVVALKEVAAGRFEQALAHTEKLIELRPSFRLAHLIKGDLLIARGRPIRDIGSGANGPADRLADLRAEAIARLRAYREPPSRDKIPSYLMKLRPDQQYAMVVDTERSRLYLYRNEGDVPRLIADYYVSSGKQGPMKLREGDLKTPVGVYHVTTSVPAEKLPDFYGSGAFPLNYPNDWDRRQGRTGHGIWLHGTPPDTYSRPPRASDGCVVLTNDDLNAVAKHVQVGLTPVIISDQVQWVDAADWKRDRDNFLEQLERWRRDWESRDVEKYLRHYSRNFSSDKQNFESFARAKREIGGRKEWIKVQLSELTVLRSPGREDLIVVTFNQDYRSNNLNQGMKKRQYWTREGDHWRILSEGAA